MFLQHSCDYLALISFDRMMKLKINWDAIGITTSMACAIYCAVLPLLLTSLPLFGINLLDSLVFEYGIISLAFMIGFFSLRHGHRRHRRGLMPVVFLLSGFLFLLAKQICSNC